MDDDKLYRALAITAAIANTLSLPDVYAAADGYEAIIRAYSCRDALDLRAACAPSAREYSPRDLHEIP